MIKLGLEIPDSVLSLVSPLCDYDFALAHRVLENESYRAFYSAQRRSGRFVLMDNSFHELGHPLSVGELFQAAKLINPSVLVAPDKLGEGDWTYQQFVQLAKDPRSRDYVLAATICGDTPEARSMYLANVRHLGARMYCFPFKEPRLQWYVDLVSMNPWLAEQPIHLFGGNDFDEHMAWVDTLLRWRHTGPVTLDTSKPIKVAMLGQKLQVGTRMHGLGPLDHDAQINFQTLTNIYFNIAFFRRYL
jgi:hypothetical protein